MDNTDLYLIKESVKMTQTSEQLWLENLNIITKEHLDDQDIKTLFLNILTTFNEQKVLDALVDDKKQNLENKELIHLFTEEMIKSTQFGATDAFILLNVIALKQALDKKQLILDAFIEQTFKQEKNG